MDINFIQETIDSLRTMTQQNGALTRQNSQLLNEIAKESTFIDKAEEIKAEIKNAKPEIDTSNIASKDLERFFGVKPIETYEFMTEEEVCSTLEEIMTTMDIDLTPEQAKEITNNLLNKE